MWQRYDLNRSINKHLSSTMPDFIIGVQQRISRNSRLVFTLAIIFIISMLLRVYRLDAQSLWLDEGGTWAEVTGQTGKGWLTLIGELISPDASYPLYHLILKLWVSIVGDSEWALRFPSALAGALAVVVVVLAGGELREPRSQESGVRIPSEQANRRTGEQEPGTTLTPSRAPTGGAGSNGFTINPSPSPRRGRAGLGVRGASESASLGQDKGRDALLERLRSNMPLFALGLFAACSPYALWHAQDAKAYSLLFLAVSVLIWLLLRAMRRGSLRDWAIVLAVGLASLLVHRLALLVITGVLLAIALGHPLLARRWRIGALVLALACGAIGLAGTLRAAAVERVLGGRSGIVPLESLWLTFVRFDLDRSPGDIDGFLALPAAIWLLPALLLGLWGLVLLVRDARDRQPQAIALLCVLFVPLLLLAALLAFAPVYESRYAMVAFPGWLLATSYPFVRQQRTPIQRHQNPARASRWPLIAGWALFGVLLLSSGLSLFQPNKGLFSGDPLKEQWREAVTDIARRVHPDDLVLIQPYYVAGMYAYYAPRVTPDPLPKPVTFPVFAEGDTCGRTTPAEIRACWQRRYEPFFNAQAAGKKRALLLIAPDHARIVDPPKTLAELIAETPAGQPLPTQDDRYGWVGLRFQYPQKTWPCGGTGDALIGVAVMCQSFPETYNAGQAGIVPQPDIMLQAIFGGEIRLRGFSIDLHGGVARPGGTLPITLYWAAFAPPTNNYRMFQHLCRDCELPPLANDDAPPLAGYPPAGQTTTWRVGDPLHDERAIFLPKDLPPGRYTIVLGVYGGDGSPATRLSIAGVDAAQRLSANRLVLGEIEVRGN